MIIEGWDQMLRSLQYLGIMFAMVFLLAACSSSQVTGGNSGGFSSNTNGPSTSNGNGSSQVSIGQQTKTSGCQAQGGVEDKQCTPGAIFPNATASQICVSGYSKSVRNVPVSVKNQAYAEYGITHHQTGEYEVDHLISLELGGSNDLANLWPEAASPHPGFHEKDQVENYLHDQVCSGKISLKNAQSEIANNWLDVYRQMGGSYSSSSSNSDSSYNGSSSLIPRTS